jgi:hypothetical protein
MYYPALVGVAQTPKETSQIKSPASDM